jgi:SAM-dependent methyltransferase
MTDWKEEMFVELADEFTAILASKGVPPTFSSFIGSLSQQGQFCRVLDVGCGTGRLFGGLSALSGIVVGLDYSAQLLAAAQRNSKMHRNVVTVRHDMRLADQIFVGNSFDLIIKAYTSLGYFSYDEEVLVLRSLGKTAMPNALLVIDTFNASWICQNKVFNRRSELPAFSLVESYRWNPARHIIECNWRYSHGNSERDIDFDLEGYDLRRVDQLLNESGWSRRALYADYDPSTRLPSDVGSERLIVVAEKRS